MMSDTRGPVLGLDVGGQLGLELEHGAALLSLALEVRQLVQGLVRVHPLEVASVKIKNINAGLTRRSILGSVFPTKFFLSLDS